MAFPRLGRLPPAATHRHPIAMASTAKPPDPMPCALAVILLPESRARGCHMQKTMFLGPTWKTGRITVELSHKVTKCVLGP
jgi:hypothetical protein